MDMRTNYETSYRATKRLAEANATRLMQANLPLTPLNIYLAHLLGSDATALLRADSSTPAEQVVPRAARSNPSLFKGRTVGQAISKINEEFTQPRRMPFR